MGRRTSVCLAFIGVLLAGLAWSHSFVERTRAADPPEGQQRACQCPGRRGRFLLLGRLLVASAADARPFDPPHGCPELDLRRGARPQDGGSWFPSAPAVVRSAYAGAHPFRIARPVS